MLLFFQFLCYNVDVERGSFMRDITLHTNNNTATTSVPNVFIDELMTDANGEYVKIYLYLLRCMNSAEGFSISGMADKLDHTEKDVKRALKYWEKMHVLQLEYDNNQQLSGICLLDSSSLEVRRAVPVTCTAAPVSDPSGIVTAGMGTQGSSGGIPASGSPTAIQCGSAAAPAASAAAAAASGNNGRRPSYTREQLLSFRENEATGDLFFIIERYIGHPLSATDYETIYYWYDGLHFSADLIEYLVESCVDKGHKSLRYMDKVALSWSDASIRTVEDAKCASNMHSQIYYGVMKAFGISGRNLADYELKLVDKWSRSYGFDSAIIGEACKRTLQATSQPSFQYADSILENWHKNNVHKLEDIALLDSAFKRSKPAAPRNVTVSRSGNNRFNNFSQRSYNFDQLEKQLLNSSTQ